ncbi:ABC transporter substrate-binding protein [Agrobacterium pusense]|uniref:ABC transporter substrate-binding protein n=1 Tax=Agrobacterium pusense TaxID=648995 RepID=UPI001C6E588E|nr:ABC transporter substrate-binding protein [Agrobacterium pusense]MBW9068905.1 ABC transporter substrate-binding protein [Agrobacterium pusense]MBW9084145.1 ABC transporter substrate-binding protein [Agrobacterium pusense]MBW9123525.1 ABC transporter substrate-binding protein [Agrobacterium pusense]MBW9136112.1 ABC transporter substrate-binding protein [Agrobacterium pusense]
MKKTILLSGILMLGAAALPAQAQQTVTFLGYSGLFQERYTKAVIEPFMAANPDIKVEYFPQQGSAAMLGSLRAQKAAPQSDIALMDVSVAKTGTDEGLFDKIDESVTKNVADLYPNARFEGVAGVGVTFDNLVLIYNTDAIKTPPDSWNALKDSAFKGKVAMLSAPDIVGIGTTIIMDHMNGGTDFIKNIDAGINAMAEVAPNVQTWEPKPEVYPNVVNGQVSLGVGWNARSQVNADGSKGKMKVVLPKEGTILQINTLNLVKGGPSSEAARKFVDYALSPEAQAAFTAAMYYAPTNAKATVAADVSDRTVVKAMDKVIPVDWIGLSKVRDQITQDWRRKVIPLSR